MRHIGEGVGVLLLGQRTARPVGKARALVDIALEQGFHQPVIGNRVAEAQRHAGHLRIEHRVRDQPAGHVEEDFQILARSVEDLDDAVVGHELPEGLHVQSVGERVDDDLGIPASRLDQTQGRPVDALTHELGIDCDVVVLGEGRRRPESGLLSS